MRVYLDTEFIDTGRTIDFISIGLVAEDGKELYRINSNPNPVGVAVNHPWLSKHVVPQLPVTVKHTSEFPPEERKLFDIMSVKDWYVWDKKHPDFQYVKDGYTIRREVHSFLAVYKDVELWADYAAYDHVVLAQMFGRMIDLPKAVPMFTHELRQEWERLGKPELPEQLYGEHHALHDARHNKTVGDFLKMKDSQATGFNVDLRGSTVMPDKDMDVLVNKMARKLTQNLLPKGGVRITTGGSAPKDAAPLEDCGPAVGQIVHDPEYVRTKTGMTSTSYNVAWLANETDKLIAALNAPQTAPEPRWQYRCKSVGWGRWMDVAEGPWAWLNTANGIEFRRKPVEDEYDGGHDCEE